MENHNLDEQIGFLRQQTRNMTGEHLAAFLTQLSDLLAHRSRTSQRPSQRRADLEEAATLMHVAIESITENLWYFQAQLGLRLSELWHIPEDSVHNEQSIAAFQTALDSCPSDQSPALRNNLITALNRRTWSGTESGGYDNETIALYLDLLQPGNIYVPVVSANLGWQAGNFVIDTRIREMNPTSRAVYNTCVTWKQQ